MPRPTKKRQVCCLPFNREFLPARSAVGQIVLSIDEYETVRLIDLETCTQEECAAQMRVSRTTVQGIYNAARRKIADALVNGRRLVISGGDYVVCRRYSGQCGKGCHRHCCKNPQQE
ncbi:MAG: DUF134 domain-containing protein [Acutalibacteraceae bacterium]